MREKDIETKVGEYVRKKNGMFYKFTSPQRRNVPDRIVVLFGVPMFLIEFKAPGKKPTAGQKREIQRLKDRGVAVFVCDDVDQGKKIVDVQIAINT
jgi:hypothetical protein